MCYLYRIDVMKQIVLSPHFYVMQVEIDVYSMLKKVQIFTISSILC